MHIKYTTTDGWEITETHLAVAKSFDDIPQTKKGNPKIGQFPYKGDHSPAVTEVTYTINLDDFDLYNPDNGKYQGELFIAAHAVVRKLTGYDSMGNPIYDEETAWADTYGQPFNENNGWALWLKVTLT